MLSLSLIVVAGHAAWQRARLDAFLRDTASPLHAEYGRWGSVARRAQRLIRGLERDRQAEQAKLADFLQAIQASPNGVVLLDAQHRIDWCNATAAAHLGVDGARDVGQHVTNLVRAPEFVGYLAQEDFAAPCTFAGSQSRPAAPVLIEAHVHAYAGSKALLLTRDVTQREQAEAMRRDFVANVSHEIRTPLTVISGYVESLRELPLSESERADALERMGTQAQRMSTLVGDLLQLSRLDAAPPAATGQWFSVQTLVARAHALARDLPGEKPSFSAQPGDDWQLDAHWPDAESALSNLVTNALRYTPAGKAVGLRCFTDDSGDLIMEVSDQGSGIAPEHLPRLTERFYRVDKSRSRETGGTGLGLAIAKHAMQRHGGALEVFSTVGQGSRFTLRWPAARVRQHGSAASLANHFGV